MTSPYVDHGLYHEIPASGQHGLGKKKTAQTSSQIEFHFHWSPRSSYFIGVA